MSQDRWGRPRIKSLAVLANGWSQAVRIQRRAAVALGRSEPNSTNAARCIDSGFLCDGKKNLPVLACLNHEIWKRFATVSSKGKFAPQKRRFRLGRRSELGTYDGDLMRLENCRLWSRTWLIPIDCEIPWDQLQGQRSNIESAVSRCACTLAGERAR